MTATDTSFESNDFPEGYFILRSVANGRLLDVFSDDKENGACIGLFNEKEPSIVENRRNPNANNQVFFIDADTGVLCSKSSGHAVDVVGDRLVLRHRQPASVQKRSLPRFRFHGESGEISVLFSGSSSRYVLTSLPLRKPRSMFEDATEMLSSAMSMPFNLITGPRSPTPSTATPEAVSSIAIDLNEDEIVPEEQGEEAEVDDSPEPSRQVAVVRFNAHNELEQSRRRRQWIVIPLRRVNAKTGSI